jgi:hypothetical protein
MLLLLPPSALHADAALPGQVTESAQPRAKPAHRRDAEVIHITAASVETLTAQHSEGGRFARGARSARPSMHQVQPRRGYPRWIASAPARESVHLLTCL